MRKILSFILYGMTICYAILWSIEESNDYAIFGIVCCIFALLLDILNELKKLNDKIK